MPHIVHERGQHGADARQRRHLAALAPGHPQDRVRDQIDDPGDLERPADDEHGGDGDDGRMAETAKRQVGWHNAADHGEDQRGEGHHVIAPAPPHEEHEREAEDGEDDDLISCHVE
jgi:hypothetical protein